MLTIRSAAIATAQTAALKSYYNQEHKAGFKYPGNWKLSKEKGPIGDEPGFSIVAGVDPAASSLRGQLKQASVTLAMGGTDEAACKAYTIPITANRDKPAATKIGRLTFYKMSGSDGAAGSIGYTEYYRIFHDGRCYELSFMMFKRNVPKDGRYVQTMDQQFNAILRSFLFRQVSNGSGRISSAWLRESKTSALDYFGRSVAAKRSMEFN